jgi:hypothetical protein
MSGIIVNPLPLVNPSNGGWKCHCGWPFPNLNCLVVEQSPLVCISLECPECLAVWLFPLIAKPEPFIRDLPLMQAFRAR